MDRYTQELVWMVEKLTDKLRRVLNIPEYSASYPHDMEYFNLNQEAIKLIRKGNQVDSGKPFSPDASVTEIHLDGGVPAGFLKEVLEIRKNAIRRVIQHYRQITGPRVDYYYLLGNKSFRTGSMDGKQILPINKDLNYIEKTIGGLVEIKRSTSYGGGTCIEYRFENTKEMVRFVKAYDLQVMRVERETGISWIILPVDIKPRI